MAGIIDINEGRRRVAAKKGFAPWSRRFSISFNENTSIRRLDNSVIGYLVRGGEDSAMALYELIMATKGLGPGMRFDYLDSESKMYVTDITLFLLDLIRFEAMYRLGWLDEYAFLSVPLVDLIANFKDQFSALRNSAPVLSQSHPLFRQYLAEYEGDRNVFLRKLIPEAIKTFCDNALQLE
ncbi:MAG: hypothetical protein ABSE08_01975 [Syntrophobacteraceae bacterium]|jgi:hypothetical protein